MLGRATNHSEAVELLFNVLSFFGVDSEQGQGPETCGHGDFLTRTGQDIIAPV